MPKNKERSETEYYKSLIRELQKENKQLKRQLTHHEKRKHRHDEVINDYEELLTQYVPIEETSSKRKSKCSECGKGDLEEFEILNKVYGTCNSCGLRKRIK